MSTEKPIEVKLITAWLPAPPVELLDDNREGFERVYPGLRAALVEHEPHGPSATAVKNSALRRVYTSWRKAACDARGWGQQTGYKHRVQRYREWWVVRRTGKRTGPFPPAVPKYIGEVRLTVVFDTEIMMPGVDRETATERLREALKQGRVPAPGES